MKKTFRALLALVLLSGAAFLMPLEAEAYPTSTIDFQGHGWGHGRGMGQYGSLGYAVDHGWDHQAILNHFYGGTSSGTIGNDFIGVRLTKLDNQAAIILQEQGRMTTNVAPGTFSALRVVRVGNNTFEVYSGSHCGGPWTSLGGAIDTGGGYGLAFWSELYYTPTGESDNHSDMLQVCEPNGSGGWNTRWLRGEMEVWQGDGTPCSLCVVNKPKVEAYLRGVVPRESPASWGDAGGGRGMEALKAQAVAARSYGWAEARNAEYGLPAYVKTCDTTACQVYMGRAEQINGVFKSLEHPNTDRAIRETAGHVRKFGSAVARTEFSSSTGGHTAGGIFTAVPDAGDRIASNPNHIWSTQIAVSAIQAAWPQIGSLSSFDVIERNGLGDWGGRATKVRIVGSKGSVTVSGNEVRSKLGLKSDWFRVFAKEGYWIAASDGGVFSFGSAPFHGSMGGKPLVRPVVGMHPTVSLQGYWLVASDGGIFSFGDAGFYGSTGGMALRAPITGMAPTKSGQGYWLVATDGGIFSFGDAGFYGSTGAMTLVSPVVGMAPTTSGNGYWLVASDGGIFSFGDAPFYGSMGGSRLNKPVVGMARTPSGNGYWLVASDGGIFTFGDASFYGSTGAMRLDQPVVGMAATPSGKGYYLVAKDGGVFTFGDAVFRGSVPGVAPTSRTAKVGIGLSYSEQ